MSVVKAYAKALYEVAVESKVSGETASFCGEIEGQLENVISSVESSRELKVALFSPVTNVKEKIALVRAVSAKAATNSLVSDFLVLLANKGRLPALRAIREEFGSVRLIAEGGMPGLLSSAEPMNEADISGLAGAFGRKLGKKVTFRVSTEPALLAGMKVTVGGVTYDGTLRSQLQRLRDRLLVGMPGEN